MSIESAKQVFASREQQNWSLPKAFLESFKSFLGFKVSLPSDDFSVRYTPVPDADEDSPFDDEAGLSTKSVKVVDNPKPQTSGMASSQASAISPERQAVIDNFKAGFVDSLKGDSDDQTVVENFAKCVRSHELNRQEIDNLLNQLDESDQFEDELILRLQHEQFDYLNSNGALTEDFLGQIYKESDNMESFSAKIRDYLVEPDKLMVAIAEKSTDMISEKKLRLDPEIVQDIQARLSTMVNDFDTLPSDPLLDPPPMANLYNLVGAKFD